MRKKSSGDIKIKVDPSVSIHRKVESKKALIIIAIAVIFALLLISGLIIKNKLPDNSFYLDMIEEQSKKLETMRQLKELDKLRAEVPQEQQAKQLKELEALRLGVDNKPLSKEEQQAQLDELDNLSI